MGTCKRSPTQTSESADIALTFNLAISFASNHLEIDLMNSSETIADYAPYVGQSNFFDIDITESKLTKSIESHNHRIRTIENASGPSRRTQFLREEVARLEIELKMAYENYI